MALTIYGSPQSRTMRTLWAVAELGLAYKHVNLDWDDPHLKSDGFLALNPAGAIPTIIDDGVVVADSMAINLYLARRYGQSGETPLFPPEPAAEAAILQWSFWAQGHLKPWLQRDARLQPLLGEHGGLIDDEIVRHLQTLNRILSHQPWLAAEHFTIGDLNVAGVLSPSRSATLSLEAFPAVRDWVVRCYARPHAQAVRLRYAQPPA